MKKNRAFQKNYMKVGVKKLFRACMMPTRTWRAHAEEKMGAKGENNKERMEMAKRKSRTPSQ